MFSASFLVMTSAETRILDFRLPISDCRLGISHLFSGKTLGIFKPAAVMRIEKSRLSVSNETLDKSELVSKRFSAGACRVLKFRTTFAATTNSSAFPKKRRVGVPIR
jgi:hypothetical protein